MAVLTSGTSISGWSGCGWRSAVAATTVASPRSRRERSTRWVACSTIWPPLVAGRATTATPGRLSCQWPLSSLTGLARDHVLHLAERVHRAPVVGDARDEAGASGWPRSIRSGVSGSAASGFSTNRWTPRSTRASSSAPCCVGRDADPGGVRPLRVQHPLEVVVRAAAEAARPRPRPSPGCRRRCRPARRPGSVLSTSRCRWAMKPGPMSATRKRSTAVSSLAGRVDYRGWAPAANRGIRGRPARPAGPADPGSPECRQAGQAVPVARSRRRHAAVTTSSASDTAPMSGWMGA